MKDKTVIYYSSNHEDPKFESKIMENIYKNCGGLPIVSCTQVPVDFGTNVCVGREVGWSSINCWRQAVVAAKNAKTKYVICTESDALYPPEYFEFNPTNDRTCYRYLPIYVMFNIRGYRGKAYKKKYTEGAQIMGRDYLIETYEKFLEGVPDWVDRNSGTQHVLYSGNEPFKHHKSKSSPIIGWEYINGEVAVIAQKSGNGIRKFTNTLRDVPPEIELPYWGNIQELHNKLYE